VAVNRLQRFLDAAAGAPPERDARYFRTWQRVSVHVQREVRALVAKSFFADETPVAKDLDRAFSVAVYSACQPCYGRRPMEFTYDMGDPDSMAAALRLIGRSLQARLAHVSSEFRDAKLIRKFAPVWHLDVVNIVKRKPRLLIELLAREATMINALVELGTTPDERSAKKFVKSIWAAARVLRVDSESLQDLVLRTGIENLDDGRIFEDDDTFPPGSPDAGIGREENGDHRSSDCCCQMADAGVVADIHAGF
jgi:hypothetical protein